MRALLSRFVPVALLVVLSVQLLALAAPVHYTVPQHFNNANLRAVHLRLIQHFTTQTVFTPQTVFLLNNTACDYSKVPPGALVRQIEFAADGQTVTRVLFAPAPVMPPP